MYKALVTWIKGNSVSAPHTPSESGDDLIPTIRSTLPEKPTKELEMLSEQVETIKANDDKPKPDVDITNEKGDVVKQKALQKTIRKPSAVVPTFANEAGGTTKSKTELTYKELVSRECTIRQAERLEELKREQGQNDDNAEVLGIPLPFRSVGERSSLTNLHNLLEQCPQPQPPLLNKQLKTLQLNADQAVIMAEQVLKMKTGMERLQEIIKKFNCTERFKQDIDFIIANVGPAIAKAEASRRLKTVNNSKKKLN